MIIFDLDHTLFNTSILKEDLKDVFVKHGLNEEEFWKTLRKSYEIDPKTSGCYSIEKHFWVLDDFDKSKKDEIKKEIKKLIYFRGRDYLYDDAIPVLNKFKNKKKKLILISKGMDDFQNLKIEATNLRNFFDNIFITAEDKISIISNILKNGEAVFNINDHAEESRLVAKNFPNIFCILIRRNRQEKPKIDIPTASNLKEVFKYISLFQKD